MIIFKDDQFQKHLLAFICRDRNFLKDLGHLIEVDDFKPTKTQGNEHWIIAEAALTYWKRFSEPIGDALRYEILDFSEKMKFGERQKKRLSEVVEEIYKPRLVAVDAVAEKVIEYKKHRLRQKSVEELIELQERGELTDDKWMRICNQAVDTFGKAQYKSSNYLEEVEERIARRDEKKRLGTRFPFLWIDPLDSEIRTITRGQTGLILAFLGMGKSYALEHIALAYAYQGLNVLDFTLEDPKDVREDRYDAAITGILINKLDEVPNKFKKRFLRQRNLIHSRIKIVDGTQDKLTISRMDDIWNRERNKGFLADATVIDYDAKIEPEKKREERRFEFFDIHSDLQRFAAKRRQFLWVAAQATRISEGKKIIKASHSAEDLDKIRASFCAIGIGEGDWGKKSRYLNVFKNKNDDQGIGWNIMTDYARGLFFDRDATLDMMEKIERENRKKKREDDEED